MKEKKSYSLTLSALLANDQACSNSSIQDLRVGVANELDSKNLDMEDYLKIRKKLLEEMRDKKIFNLIPNSNKNKLPSTPNS